MTRFILGLILTLALPHLGFTQTSFKRVFWEAKLGEDSYVVAIDAITSVSLQTYIVDGVMEVTETAIDTRGSALTRFYFIEKKEALTPELSEKVAPAIEMAKKTKEALENLAGTENPLETQKVLKNYPTTTHAKTIEYRLKSKAAVKRLYENISKAFKENLQTSYDTSQSDKSN